MILSRIEPHPHLDRRWYEVWVTDQVTSKHRGLRDRGGFCFMVKRKTVGSIFMRSRVGPSRTNFSDYRVNFPGYLRRIRSLRAL